MKNWIKITLIILAVIILTVIIFPKEVISYKMLAGGLGPSKVPLNYTEKSCNCIGLPLYFKVYDAPRKEYCIGIKNSCECTNWYNESSNIVECEQ